MPLYLVADKKGLAIIRADEEMFAKLDLMDHVYIDDASELRVVNLDEEGLNGAPIIVRSFKDGSEQI